MAPDRHWTLVKVNPRHEKADKNLVPGLMSLVPSLYSLLSSWRTLFMHLLPSTAKQELCRYHTISQFCRLAPRLLVSLY